MIQFSVNSTKVEFDGDDSTPLLWVLRDHVRLTGTKFGCGIGQCGACTIHVDGRAQRSCVTPVSSVAGRDITTIEGLAPSDDDLHPVQQAWLEHDVPQCGYCQAGTDHGHGRPVATHPESRAMTTSMQITPTSADVARIRVFAKRSIAPPN